MIINKTNAQLINSKAVCVHDDILDSLFFNKDSKELILKCIKCSTQHTNYSIRFRNVIGFQMSA